MNDESIPCSDNVLSCSIHRTVYFDMILSSSVCSFCFSFSIFRLWRSSIPLRDNPIDPPFFFAGTAVKVALLSAKEARRGEVSSDCMGSTESEYSSIFEIPKIIKIVISFRNK
ncbi:hypothetical protein RF11_06417 [Thelohanellus kitauei]|uniref:Uncharacterized protein n=1 Tax=Thelohanellus kitauei TaxID=669202 RepID=A0A0C2NEZ9_THEKT|nr:hypothetical protein RF11_06417 [Thelohanellus kitauei]